MSNWKEAELIAARAMRAERARERKERRRGLAMEARIREQKKDYERQKQEKRQEARMAAWEASRNQEGGGRGVPSLFVVLAPTILFFIGWILWAMSH